ncbi:FAD-binding oxidoreductase [Saccharothrix yanglingensis]|uniref:FAD-binding oxidoreductase n=1 Tax=Saccharothrix yanglingensis TaxID=659496 RepID=UPI0027D26180|nr:FAD-binding oxidoreductase [Saccharothrix yanglingensis]
MKFPRRAFLQSAVLVAAGHGHGGESGPTNWARLRSRLRERLVLPSDTGYDDLRQPYNTVYAGRRPAAIARCARPADVQACLEFAARERIPVAARSGRHSYAGYSVPERGLVIDVAGLSGVDVGPGGLVRVGAGTSLIGFYEGLGARGRSVPAGTCATVGIAGLALGGGISVIGRKYGLTCDRLVGARIVTPDGCVRSVSAESEPDLLWALRGGGGGNFGVVTSFTFDSDPAPDVTVFALGYPAAATGDVFGAWQDWIADAPDELWSGCRITSGDPSTALVSGAYVGPARGLDPLLDRLGRVVPPTTREVREMDYLTAMRYYAGCLPACPPRRGLPFVASSRMLDRPVEPERMTGLVDGRRNVVLLFDSFGGALARVAPDATAFPHRSALASVQVFVDVIDMTEAEARLSLASIRDGLGTGATGYVNYIDPDMPDWPTAYYGANAPRLRRVARRYDPDRVLAFPQGLA